MISGPEGVGYWEQPTCSTSLTPPTNNVRQAITATGTHTAAVPQAKCGVQRAQQQNTQKIERNVTPRTPTILKVSCRLDAKSFAPTKQVIRGLKYRDKNMEGHSLRVAPLRLN